MRIIVYTLQVLLMVLFVTKEAYCCYYVKHADDIKKVLHQHGGDDIYSKDGLGIGAMLVSQIPYNEVVEWRCCGLEKGDIQPVLFDFLEDIFMQKHLDATPGVRATVKPGSILYQLDHCKHNHDDDEDEEEGEDDFSNIEKEIKDVRGMDIIGASKRARKDRSRRMGRIHKKIRDIRPPKKELQTFPEVDINPTVVVPVPKPPVIKPVRPKHKKPNFPTYDHTKDVPTNSDKMWLDVPKSYTGVGPLGVLRPWLKKIPIGYAKRRVSLDYVIRSVNFNVMALLNGHSWINDPNRPPCPPPKKVKKRNYRKLNPDARIGPLNRANSNIKGLYNNLDNIKLPH